MLTLKVSATIFSDQLLAWYDANRRFLPWREKPSPYHVWLSEIMLQQTQVQTVLPYYKRFITALPTIEALAKADSDLLYKLWEGLGYYSRANNLQKASITICEEFDGQLPEDYQTLQTLAGIGPYTAGAIASIAFGQRVSAVDGNVLRILSRLTTYDGAINVAQDIKPLKQLAESLVPAHRPGDFNQALMDLGAMICSANGAPHCGDCPVSESCLAYEKNLTGIYPLKKAKKPRQIEQHTIVILQYKDDIFIQKRPKGQLLAGLWQFIDLSEEYHLEAINRWLISQQFQAAKVTALGPARHIFTHKEWHMTGYHVMLSEKPVCEGQWVSIDRIRDTYAVPGALHFYRNKLFDLAKI